MTPLVEAMRPPAPSPSPQMSALVERLMAEDAGLPDLFSLPLAQARAQFERGASRWNRDLPQMAVARSVTIARADADDPISANIRIPLKPRHGAIVYVHGGGWMFGSPQTHERAIRCLAETTGMAVIAPRYRLAPEAPFPSGLEDVRAALAQIRADMGDWGIDVGPLGIAGDSAGANLAMAALLDAQSTGASAPDFAMLFYGVFDWDFTTESYNMADPVYGLSAGRMKAYWDRYAPDPSIRANPLVSPLKASDKALRSLPPLYLNAAQIDPLRDDTLGLAAKLKALGRNADACHLHRGVVHGFMQMTIALDEARTAFDLAATWLEFILHSQNQGRNM